MELTKRQQEIQEALIKACEAAKANEEYQKEFVDSPVEFVQRFTELKLTQREVYEVINLRKTSMENVELKEEQLEAIAGGKDGEDEHNGFTWDQFRFLMGWY